MFCKNIKVIGLILALLSNCIITTLSIAEVEALEGPINNNRVLDNPDGYIVINGDLELQEDAEVQILGGITINFQDGQLIYGLDAKPGSEIFTINPGSQLIIQNASFLSFEDCDLVDFQNVKFENCGAITVAGPGDYEFQDFEFQNPVGDVFFDLRDGAVNVQIWDCDFENLSGDYAIKIHSDGGDSPYSIYIHNNTFVGDFGNEAIDYGVLVTDVNSVDHENPIEIYNNEFECVADMGGVLVQSDVPAQSTIIRNNIIRGLDLDGSTAYGIYVDADDNANTHEHPYIYNNYVKEEFTCGIYVEVENNGSVDEDDNPLMSSILNNVCSIWNLEEDGAGFRLHFIDAATLGNDGYSDGDVRFANNIASDCDVGLLMNQDPGEDGIHYMGFKDNTTNIDYGAGTSDDKIDDEGEDRSQLYNDEGSYWSFVSGTDLHLLVDDWLDINDLIDAGKDDDNWRDKDHVAIENGPQYLYTRADIGLYGGFYSCNNTNFANDANDYCYVTTPHFSMGEPPPLDFYRIGVSLYGLDAVANIPNPDDDGLVLAFDEGYGMAVSSIDYEGHADIPIIMCGYEDAAWSGITLNDTTDADECLLRNVIIEDATYGIHATGVTDAYGARVTVDSCTIRDCGQGIYANNSRVAVSNTVIEGSTGTSGGVYLTGCSAGKVILDGDTLRNNCTGSGYGPAGLFLYSSAPEIYDCVIKDNTGTGITCLGSSPDLNTYFSSAPHANTITSNGTSTQTGTNGAEIY